MTLALSLITIVALLQLAALGWLLRQRTIASGPRLTGRTVILERAGADVLNVRGIVLAEHIDRWTLGEPQAVHPTSGDVPLEHPIIHIAKSVVLSVCEPAANMDAG